MLTCLLGFSGFLPIEELLSIKIKQLRINESHLEILVPKSKTDKHREGNIVCISRISSECCPVKFLEKYLQKTNIEISKDGETPLIGRIFKTKKGHKISKTQGISYSRIREVFKDYITDITANPEKDGLYSLRTGGLPLQPAMARQTNWCRNKVDGLQKKRETDISRTVLAQD